ncbi:MAG: hypothetical protein RMJ54_17885 [Roseiflexaceae bacterium]|nr:hypothetical protein [Roseiflexaceae bacterium]
MRLLRAHCDRDAQNGAFAIVTHAHGAHLLAACFAHQRGRLAQQTGAPLFQHGIQLGRRPADLDRDEFNATQLLSDCGYAVRS